jgi:AmmeMemoRadiSam system protein A
MFSPEHNQLLLQIARQSIAHGLEKKSGLSLALEEYPENLRETRATFVTLKIESQLRGCVGTTKPLLPLVLSVSDNAYSSAFRDPRFKPLTREEFELINISISILTPSTPLAFSCEYDLFAQLRPGVDGLIIEKDMRRATFLPSVWEQLPNPEDFLKHLKLKAGMRLDHTPDRAWIYQSVMIEE